MGSRVRPNAVPFGSHIDLSLCGVVVPSSSTSREAFSPWPHRLAVALACVTFPLIWVGGLVTTYDAGMAVPDWPSTYGYNLFLYPWQTWIAGPWDLFIEHGHRLLGSLAGLITIGLLVAVFRTDARRWMRGLAAAALALVIVQGVLGGLRVLLDERTLALVHGCVGPAFFALTVGLCVVTSRKWRDATPIAATDAGAKLHLLATATTVIAFVQLVLGAVLRHIPVGASPDLFRVVVIFHLLFAAVLLVHVAMLSSRALFGRNRHPLLRSPAMLLSLFMVCQIVLGAGAWVVKYSWPSWAGEWPTAAWYTTIEANGLLQSMTVTAHSANGSLILATATALAIRSFRVLRFAPAAIGVCVGWQTRGGVLA